MNDEKCGIASSIDFTIRKKISYLKPGDKVWIVSSDGYLLRAGVVERERGSFYVEIDGLLYWKKGIDGKHRYSKNYLQFAMTPEDGRKYVVYYPVDFKDE